MSKSNIKQRIRRAKNKAKKDLEAQKYTIINSDNDIICFTATFGQMIEKKIRIVVDEITPDDIALIKKLNVLNGQTKEIWCRRDRGWEYLIFDKDNNQIQ